MQEYLWTGYSTGAYSIEGIAAMSSMHVAMVVLFSSAGFHVRRIPGYAHLFSLVLVFASSVHLGWHYAVDGQMSILS
jgi:hypothetical protein